MLEAIASQPNYAAARVWLDATAMRHQALAANLANASTPGYPVSYTHLTLPTIYSV